MNHANLAIAIAIIQAAQIEQSICLIWRSSVHN